MKWALLPADNDPFCDGGERSGHRFDAAPLWLVQMVGAVVARLPNRLRCLPSEVGQVLAADRCGISVVCEWCWRAELVPGGGNDLTLPALCTLAAGQARAEIQTGELHSHGCISTFWLLPKTIGSPLDPCTACPNRFSASTSSVTCGEREPHSLLIYKNEALFTHLEGGRLYKQHISRGFFMYLNVWNHCARGPLVRDQNKRLSKPEIPVIWGTLDPKCWRKALSEKSYSPKAASLFSGWQVWQGCELKSMLFKHFIPQRAFSSSHFFIFFQLCKNRSITLPDSVASN